MTPERSVVAMTCEALLEATPQAVLLADPTLLITHVNDRALRLLGSTREGCLGRPIHTLLASQSAAAFRECTRRFLGDSSLRSLPVEPDLMGRREDGSEFVMRMWLSRLTEPVAGLTLVTVADVGDQRRAETAEQLMAALVESADDAIVTKNLDGIIRSWNPAAERLLGYHATEIIGQPVTRLLPDDRQTEEAMILDQLRQGQRVANFETVRRARDGTLIDVSLTISPVRDRAGTVVGASKIMRDITGRKRSEAALQRSNSQLQRINADLDDFVYTASHDLRAPLTGVAMLVEWIVAEDATLTPRTRERLRLIQSRIDRMKRLLEDIRDYARLGQREEFSSEPMSAATLIEEIVATMYIPGGFAIRWDEVSGDLRLPRAPLEQVLQNLVNNAIKHHDRESGVVTISAEDRGLWLRFFVTDDGPGVPDEYHDLIFEMFQTLKPRDATEGSGMGLAVVRRIVRRMGGACGVESAGDRGARFWFDWPRSGRPAQDGHEIP